MSAPTTPKLSTMIDVRIASFVNSSLTRSVASFSGSPLMRMKPPRSPPCGSRKTGSKLSISPSSWSCVYHAIASLKSSTAWPSRPRTGFPNPMKRPASAILHLLVRRHREWHSGVRFAPYERLFDRIEWRVMPAEELVVHGAREHNLKNVTVRVPRSALVCITGLSGSGKSSLAFDTIYAEGQRRYVESLSAYARQFLQMMEKPDVDSIDGLSPAISIDQKTTSRNPRSTVGTVTEIYDYLRLLYARIGHPHCPICGRPIAGQSIESIVDPVLRLP